jgi:hypothetical protein
MLQNHESHFTIVRRCEGKQEHSQRWTMMNSAKALGQIIYQLHRFGRYFINDLMGILLYLTLVVSKDISTYYDALMDEAKREAEEWRGKIE